MNDKFQQPAAGIEFVSRSDGPRTLLTPEAIQAGRDRVKAGEDIERVAEDLAAQDVLLQISWLNGHEDGE